MNLPWKENPALRQVLLVCLLISGLFALFLILTSLSPSVPGLELFARANNTRTAIALTSQALYGPFPTATGPTPTPSKTPSITPSPTITLTPSSTPTPFRYFIDTATPRTLVPGFAQTFTVMTPGTNSTAIPPTHAPRQPTNPPPQVTHPPRQPTHAPQPTHVSHPTHVPRPTQVPRPTRPPRPTKTPRR